MSDTIDGINARRLSERIDLAEFDSELGWLGAILNEMLGRLESSFEQQVRFTADASHELRTPLSVILAHIELALSRPRSDEEYRDALSTCGRAAVRMKAMVEDLLTLARADAGQLELKAGPVDLDAIAEECVELLDALADRRGVTLELSGGPSTAWGDPDGLGRVLTNLVTNAILYNRPGGRVVVTTALEGNEAVLTVSDTGAGIPEEDQPMLFRRFYRADPARSREHGGSGLGLAICRSIVEAPRGPDRRRQPAGGRDDGGRPATSRGRGRAGVRLSRGDLDSTVAARPSYDCWRVVMIPTRFRDKLPRHLPYPIGAEALSRALTGAPHVESLAVTFCDEAVWPKSEFRRLVTERSPYRIPGSRIPSGSTARPYRIE